MAELFNRVCTMTIGDDPGRKFEGPPFSIDFEQKLAAKVPNATTAHLYNPNDDTVAAATPKKVGNVIKNPQIIIDAGYENEHGVCVLGQIYATEIKRQGPNRILELKISDFTSKWIYAIINQTFVKMSATKIINSILGIAGIASDNVEVGKEKVYQSFTASTLSWALTQICRDTESDFFFKAGIITIQPKAPKGMKTATRLNSSTGLLNRPEKTSRGIKFQTLFMYDLTGGSLVQIESKNINGVYSIFNGSKKFSSYSNSECEFEAAPI